MARRGGPKIPRPVVGFETPEDAAVVGFESHVFAIESMEGVVFHRRVRFENRLKPLGRETGADG
jgi:hypothetical protein